MLHLQQHRQRAVQQAGYDKRRQPVDREIVMVGLPLDECVRDAADHKGEHDLRRRAVRDVIAVQEERI